MTCKRSFLRLLCLSTLILIPCSTFAAAPRGGRGATRRRRPPTKTPIKKAVEAIRPVVEPIVEKAKDITAKLVDTELSKTREKLKQVTADAQAQIAAVQQKAEQEKDELIAEKNKFEVALADAKVASGKKIADMEKALRQAEQAQTAAEAKLPAITRQFEEIARHLATQQATDEQIKDASQQIAAGLEAKTKELADETVKLQTQTDLVAAKDGELQTEKDAHAATKAQIAPLQAAKTDALNKVETLETHKVALTAEYNVFKEQFEIIQRTFGEYQTDVVALATEANRIQEEVATAETAATEKVAKAEQKAKEGYEAIAAKIAELAAIDSLQDKQEEVDAEFKTVYAEFKEFNTFFDSVGTGLPAVAPAATQVTPAASPQIATALIVADINAWTAANIPQTDRPTLIAQINATDLTANSDALGIALLNRIAILITKKGTLTSRLRPLNKQNARKILLEVLNGLSATKKSELKELVDETPIPDNLKIGLATHVARNAISTALTPAGGAG